MEILKRRDVYWSRPAEVIDDCCLLPGIALAHAPGNGAPAPGTDGGIARDEGRGTESAPADSEGGLNRTPMSCHTHLSVYPPAVTTKLLLFLPLFGELWEVFFFYSLFLRQACVAFSIKQVCNSAEVSHEFCKCV